MHSLTKITFFFALLLLTTAVFAQGTPHMIYGTIVGADGLPPSEACLRYYAHIGGNSDTLFYPESGSACVYYPSSGGWAVQLSALVDGYEHGDVLYIHFDNSCNGDYQDIAITVDTGSSSQNYGEVSMALDIEEQRPDEFEVSSAFPNPFNSTLRIDVPEPSNYEISAYNLIGNKVADIQSGYISHSVVWDITGNAQCQRSGVYFIRVHNLDDNTSDIIRVIYQK